MIAIALISLLSGSMLFGRNALVGTRVTSAATLMVSRVRYVHVVSYLTYERGTFFTLVTAVFVAMGLFLAPVPLLFLAFNCFVALGLVQWGLRAMQDRRVRHAAQEGSRP